jgi:hypothetical protein
VAPFGRTVEERIEQIERLRRDAEANPHVVSLHMSSYRVKSYQ